jgi:hypothetical protein
MVDCEVVFDFGKASQKLMGELTSIPQEIMRPNVDADILLFFHLMQIF